MHGARDRQIIVYCSCPNEASAAKAVRLLHSHGYLRARPLRGGLDRMDGFRAAAGKRRATVDLVGVRPALIGEQVCGILQTHIWVASLCVCLFAGVAFVLLKLLAKS